MKLLETKQIKIGDKEFPLKMSIRAMIDFENMTGRSIFKVQDTLSDVSVLLFCTLKAAGMDLPYEAFMDLIDDKPEVLTQFSEIVSEGTEKKM